MLPAQGTTYHQDSILVDQAERTKIPALEGIGRLGMGLDHLGGGENLVVHDDEDAKACGIRGEGNPEGGPQIGGSIPAQLRTVAHRPDEDDRLGEIEDEIEQVSGLFERVGSVSDDGPGNGRVGKHCRHFPGQLHHSGRSDVGARP